MSLRLDTKWTFCGLQAIVMENACFRIIILPEEQKESYIKRISVTERT